MGILTEDMKRVVLEQRLGHGGMASVYRASHRPVSYTHLTLPTIYSV